MTRPTMPITEFLADPDAMLKKARDMGPVVQTDIGLLVVQHEAVRALGQSDKVRPAFSRILEQFGIHSGPFYDFMSISPLDMEGDEHRKWRALMARTFTPRSVERLRPFLRAQADLLIDELLPAGRCDFVQAYARRLPALGLCELIGVPPADREEFSGWADTIGLGFNFIMLPTKIKEVDEALVRLLDYSERLAVARRKDPQDDLVTRISAALGMDEEQGLDEMMVKSSIAGLVFAGHETTKNQLGWMIQVLSQVPAEWDRVAREPERVRDTIEEVLRFRSTATGFGRLALEDLDLFGERIPAGTTLNASIWSANRDDREFPKPMEFAVDENRAGVQLAFGQGAHHCLGAALARAELQESLLALSKRMHCPKVEEGAVFLPPLGINGPTSLPIAYEPRSADA
jgi:cytochrome P450